MTLFWIAQGIGLVALAFIAYSLQSKTKNEILHRQIIGSIFYLVHFALLSAWTGVALNGIVIARNVIFLEKNKSSWAKSPVWMWFFMALALGSLYVTWEGYISLFLTSGLLLGIYARWQDDEHRMRLLNLVQQHYGFRMRLPFIHTQAL